MANDRKFHACTTRLLSICLWLVVLGAPVAGAADLYECKGAQGVSFQNEPCAAAQKTIAHTTYDRQADAPNIVDPYQQPITRTNTGAPVMQSPMPYKNAASQQPIAYQCTAGQRTWVQYSPCPSTYFHSVSVNGIEGTTANGEHFTNGSGSTEIESPVQQQPLTSAQFCAQLGDGGPRLQHSGQSDIYERNVARSKYCGQ